MITLTSIGIANAIGMALLFLKKSRTNRLANRALALLFALIAIRLGKVIAQSSDIGLIRSIYFNLMHSVYLALGPALLFYVHSISRKTFRFESRQLWHLLPALAVLSLASTIRPAVGEPTWLNIYQVMMLFPVPYLFLSIRTVLISRNRSVWTWSVLSFVMLVVAMNWAFFLIEFPFYVVTAVLVSGLFYLMLIRFTSPKSHTPVEKVSFSLADRYFTQLDTYLKARALQNSELNLDKAATELDLPRHQLSKIVNQVSGKSFPNYINSRRIDLAKGLLLQYPNLKIAAVAFECGFHSLSRFNSAFKVQEGISPSQYRKEHLA